MKNKISLREKIYNLAERKASFLNTEVTAKGLVKTIGGAIIGTAIVANVVGCGALKNYGKLAYSDKVTESFENFRPNLNCSYFRTGTDAKSTTAIISLDTPYELKEDSPWHPIDPQSPELRKLLECMLKKSSESFSPICGADILGPKGNDIGNWFSPVNSTTVKQIGLTTFSIYPPRISSSGGGDGGSSGSSGGGGCFLGGTKILMADGSSKNIRDIRENDKVMSYSFDSNTAAPDVVGEKYSVERDEGLYSVNGVCVTKEHPFFEEADKQTIVSGLRKGQDVMGDSDHNPKTLENIAIEDIKELEMPGKFEVFNMMTKNNHNYFVSNDKGNFFLVHNKGAGGK